MYTKHLKIFVCKRRKNGQTVKKTGILIATKNQPTLLTVKMKRARTWTFYVHSQGNKKYLLKYPIFNNETMITAKLLFSVACIFVLCCRQNVRMQRLGILMCPFREEKKVFFFMKNVPLHTQVYPWYKNLQLYLKLLL